MWTLLSAGGERRNGCANGAEVDASRAEAEAREAEPAASATARDGSEAGRETSTAGREASGADRDASKADNGGVNGQISAGHGPRMSNGSLEVRIYMHPGRLPLGQVGLEQAREQFDLGAARAFGTFEEAEPACASRTGFLLELRGEGAALAEHAPSGAVLFVESLRS